MILADLPARHHQSRQTFEKSNISFFLQIVQHFLHQNKSMINGEAKVIHSSTHIMVQTCWTRMFPPLRTEIPSFRVNVTVAPRRPETTHHEID